MIAETMEVDSERELMTQKSNNSEYKMLSMEEDIMSRMFTENSECSTISMMSQVNLGGNASWSNDLELCDETTPLIQIKNLQLRMLDPLS